MQGAMQLQETSRCLQGTSAIGLDCNSIRADFGLLVGRVLVVESILLMIFKMATGKISCRLVAACKGVWANSEGCWLVTSHL